MRKRLLCIVTISFLSATAVACSNAKDPDDFSDYTLIDICVVSHDGGCLAYATTANYEIDVDGELPSEFYFVILNLLESIAKDENGHYQIIADETGVSMSSQSLRTGDILVCVAKSVNETYPATVNAAEIYYYGERLPEDFVITYYDPIAASSQI